MRTIAARHGFYIDDVSGHHLTSTQGGRVPDVITDYYTYHDIKHNIDEYLLRQPYAKFGFGEVSGRIDACYEDMMRVDEEYQRRIFGYVEVR